MNKFITQVSRDHYFKRKYDSLERFMSYYHQASLAMDISPASILEVGAGNKTVANYLKERGYKVDTCDFDAELQPDFVADIRKLPFVDSSYDLAMACEVLEHIPFEDFEKALIELRRVAKKYIIISIPYACSYFEFLFRFKINFRDKKIKKKLYLPIKLPQFCKKVDIKKNKEHYWEMGAKGCSKRKIRNLISKYFKIKKEFHAPYSPSHYFFILKKFD